MKLYLNKNNNKYVLIVGAPKDLFIDGVEYSHVTELTLDYIPNEIKVIRKENRLKEYKKIDDIFVGKSVLTKQEYNDIIKELTKSATYNDYSSYGYDFNDLDEEYKYKKFVKAYKSEYEDVKIYEDVDIIYQDITGNYDYKPFIIPIRNAVKDKKLKPEELTLYKYIPNAELMIRNIANELGYEEIDKDTVFDNTKLQFQFSSSLKFMKINGNYVNDKLFPSFYPVQYDTFEVCKEAYDRDYSKLYDMFIYYKKLFYSKIKKIDNIGELVTFLNSLYDKIYKLDVKVKDVDKKRIILNYITHKINKLLDLDNKRCEDENEQ